MQGLKLGSAASRGQSRTRLASSRGGSAPGYEPLSECETRTTPGDHMKRSVDFEYICPLLVQIHIFSALQPFERKFGRQVMSPSSHRACVIARRICTGKKGRCKATWEREFKHPWREAGLPSHHDDNVELIVNEGFCLWPGGGLHSRLLAWRPIS